MTASLSPPPWPLPPSWQIPRPPERRPAALPAGAPPAAPSTNAARSKDAAPPADAAPAPVAAPEPAITPPSPDGPARAVAVIVPAGRPDPGPPPAAPGVTVNVRRATVPGPDFAGIRELARATAAALTDGADGVVVLHDAEAMAESAWALELLHEGPAPLVLTTAANGPDDLADAVTVAAGAPDGLGCVVVARGEIHAARHIGLPGGTAEPVFASPAAGPLGHVSGGSIRLLWRPPERFTVAGPHGDRTPRVGLHAVTLGDDGELLRALARQCDGLVVAAPGARTIPDQIATVLAELAERVPVVLASGVVRHDGVPATALDPLKARVLMHVLLGAGRDREAVLAAFTALDRGVGGRF